MANSVDPDERAISSGSTLISPFSLSVVLEGFKTYHSIDNSSCLAISIGHHQKEDKVSTNCHWISLEIDNNTRFNDQFEVQSTLVISNSKGLSEILRDIRSSTYQVCRIEEKII